MTEKPAKIKDQTGQIYGNWKVVEFHDVHYTKSGKSDTTWVVEHVETGERCVKRINTLYNLRYAKKNPEKVNKWRKKWVADHNVEWNARTLENYYKNKERNKANQKAYYEKNKERLRAYGREYMRNRDKAKVNESCAKYKARRDNKEVLAGQTNKTPQSYIGRIFNAKYKCEKPDAPISQWCDPEFVKAWTKEYVQQNRERINEKQREYRKAHPEIYKLSSKRYYDSHKDDAVFKEKNSLRSQEYRARKKSQDM